MQHLLSPTSAVSTNGPNFHMEAQIPSQFDLSSRQEGEQCVRGELVALADREGQASLWGLSVADTEDRRTEL